MVEKLKSLVTIQLVFSGLVIPVPITPSDDNMGTGDLLNVKKPRLTKLSSLQNKFEQFENVDISQMSLK